MRWVGQYIFDFVFIAICLAADKPFHSFRIIITEIDGFFQKFLNYTV